MQARTHTHTHTHTHTNTCMHLQTSTHWNMLSVNVCVCVCFYGCACPCKHLQQSTRTSGVSCLFGFFCCCSCFVLLLFVWLVGWGFFLNQKSTCFLHCHKFLRAKSTCKLLCPTCQHCYINVKLKVNNKVLKSLLSALLIIVLNYIGQLTWTIINYPFSLTTSYGEQILHTMLRKPKNILFTLCSLVRLFHD